MSERTRPLRERALELCTRIELDHIDSATRTEGMLALCETLVALARDADDHETLNAWGDICGFLNAQIGDDLRRIGGAT